MYITQRASDSIEKSPHQKIQPSSLLQTSLLRSGTKTTRSHIHSFLNSPAPEAVESSSSSIERNMADGRNEARALRVLELMNDFRTLQVHINSMVERSEASPPDQQSYYLDGYVVLRQCKAEAQTVLATDYNPGALGLEPGRVPETEVQKATLQRIILDASSRRFLAHKIYMRTAAGIRWVRLRAQVLQGQKPNGRHVEALRAVDDRLRQELRNITDESVVSDLRGADRRQRYWLDEDPSLERMLAWQRRSR